MTVSLRTTVALAALLLVAGAPAAALASPESSCAAPCLKPPKSNVSIRETTGALDTNGDIVPLTTTLARGQAKTLLRVTGALHVHAGGAVTGAYVRLDVNGVAVEPAVFVVNCTAHTDCSASGSWWLDVSAAEAAHPGTFVNQALDMIMSGGNWSVGGQGTAYGATLSAELVRNR